MSILRGCNSKHFNQQNMEDLVRGPKMRDGNID